MTCTDSALSQTGFYHRVKAGGTYENVVIAVVSLDGEIDRSVPAGTAVEESRIEDRRQTADLVVDGGEVCADHISAVAIKLV